MRRWLYELSLCLVLCLGATTAGCDTPSDHSEGAAGHSGFGGSVTSEEVDPERGAGGEAGAGAGGQAGAGAEAGAGGEAGVGGGAGESADRWTTERVYRALTPMCAQCHAEGQTLPFFASLEHFQTELIDPETWVVPGRPEESSLLAIFDGLGTGQFNQMPPSGQTYYERVAGDSSKPDRDNLTDWIRYLEPIEPPAPNICLDVPGYKPLHRLNRLEYNRAVAHLTGTRSRPADDFPPEDNAYGLDNIAASLTVSALLVEKYDLAAATLSQELIPSLGAPSQIYNRQAETDMTATTGSDSGEVWNLWSSGSIYAEIMAPTAGTYTIRARVTGQQAGPDPVRITLDVNRRSIEEIDVRVSRPEFLLIERAGIELDAGLNLVGVSFLNDYYCPAERFMAGECPEQGDRNLLIDYVEVEGPTATNEDRTSAFEERWFGDCRLSDPGSLNCARPRLMAFARVVWRRPLTEDESDRLWTLVTAEVDQDEGLRAGVRQAVHALLLSPHFLFRVETGGDAGEPLTGEERATRLAAFLWRSVPDAELLDAAARGELNSDEGLVDHAALMFADPRSDALIDDLGFQWLLQRNAEFADPEYDLFPDFDDDLRASMLRETQLVFNAIWREERPILDLVNADFTFVDERLAAHYDLDVEVDDTFTRVELPRANRAGILTHGSWLVATSHRTRTSPVKRGKWVLEELMCDAPPPPPPSVEGLIEEVDQEAPLRERLEQHRADPACAACHTHMDAIGFALERFDAIGQYRTEDHGTVIETAGSLMGEVPFEDAVGLGTALREHPNLGPCMLKKVVTYALGKGVSDGELCFFDDLQATAADGDYRASSIVSAIVVNPLFKIRGAREGEENE